MRISNQTLRQLNTILRPAIERATKPSFASNPPTAFSIGTRLHRELDHTRTALSQALYKIDLATDDIGADRWHMHQLQSLRPYTVEVDTNDYVKKRNNGYQVWDGYRWTQVSKDAKIKVTSERSKATNGQLAVVVRAEDRSTNTHIFFADDNVYKRGGEISYNGPMGDNPDLSPGIMNHEVNWEDHMYNAVKMGTAISGKAAGALAMTRMGNLTPWNKGANLHKAYGWYRNKEGIYRSLSSQRNTIGAGGHRVGAKTASNGIKHFKAAGKICAIVSVAISSYEAGSAIYNQDSNQDEVITKASIDISMALVGAWGGPVGWVISGSYFILSSTGTFGDWGQPSGVNSSGIPYGSNNFGTLGGGASSRYTDEFMIDYIPPIRHKRSMMRERLYQMQAIDNTYVKPQVHYNINIDGQQEFYNRL
ncbi:hypothetical protein [Aquimarina longa]|uniref:hypothetical protein n=1 Tax=Aquimarina longa TaxID=1080221 RepID=UPI0007836045|nr:hypothetical protein [Aquimarina longa]